MKKLFLLLGILSSFSAFADCMEGVPLEEIYKASTDVALVRITKAQEMKTIHAYYDNQVMFTAEVLKSFKKSSQKPLLIQYSGGEDSYWMGLSEAYIVFVSQGTTSACMPNIKIPTRRRLTLERFKKAGMIPNDWNDTWKEENQKVEEARKLYSDLEKLSSGK